MKDYYRILDITPDADQSEIKQAYQRLKSLITKNSISLYSILPSSEKEVFLNEIEEAYKTLGDIESKNTYDLRYRKVTTFSTDERDLDSAKQLVFSFAKEPFTYLDYTRKIEKIYNESSDRIQNDYLIRSDGLSIRIITEEKDDESLSVETVNQVDEPENTIEEPAINAKDPAIQEDATIYSQQLEPVHKISSLETPVETDTSIDIKAGSSISSEKNQDVVSDIPDEQSKEDIKDENKIGEQIVIDENSEFSGPFIRKIRESMGLSVKDIAQITKISTTNLTYLEEEEYTNLPALVYIKGYLAQIAKCLNLRPDVVVRSYITRLNEKMEKKKR